MASVGSEAICASTTPIPNAVFIMPERIRL